MFHAKSHAPLPNPRELVENARRHGIDPRPGLLRLLVRRYLTAPSHTPAEQRRFATLAPRLIDAADRSTAIWAANALAGLPELPYEVAIHLARGPIEIAGPVLRHSTVLDDVSLLIIAETSTPAHAAAIASRREVSPDLAKGIAAAMHEALATLEDDAAAQLPDVEPLDEAPSTPALPWANQMPSPAFAEADPEPDAGLDFDVPDLIAEPAGPTSATGPDDELAAFIARELSALLVTEPAQPHAEEPEPALVVQEEPIAAEPTAEEPIATQPLDDEEALPIAVDAASLAPAAFLSAPPLTRAAILDRLVTLPPLPMAERIRPADLATVDRLEQAALRRQPAVFASEIEAALHIPAETAKAIVADDSGETLVVACRVLGVPFDVVSRILIFLNPAIGHSVAQVFALASLFEALPEASAQHLAVAWRREPQRRGRGRGEDAPSMRSFGAARRAAPTPAQLGVERREHG